MWRQTALGLTLAAALGAPNVALAGSSGGGACPAPMTNGSSTRATIESFCFKPTIVHVSPGDTVRWVNLDLERHTVTGANRSWGGYRAIGRGRSVSYRFEDPGVYPFYCVLHPGMIGAVVAEDGRRIGPASSATSLDAVVPVRSVSAAPEAAALPGPRSSYSRWLLLLPGAALVVALAKKASRTRLFGSPGDS